MNDTVLLDCRWLGIGGAGRLTELLLQGLGQVRPSGRWVLWGPERVRSHGWPGAELAVTSLDPRAGFGQRGWFQMPSSDLTIFMHQQRPLRRVRSITVILDTIALRFGANRLERRLKHVFLRRAARISDEVVTISEYSQACIERDLATPAERVEVLAMPVDEARVLRIRRLRQVCTPEDAALYVGAFLRHKNLPRLIAAFRETEFYAGGGKLWLVGGAPEHRLRLDATLTPADRRSVIFRERCSESELEQLFATALFLVQPSLEEGYGLPVFEAMSCRLPVCVSDGGSLPEITRGMVCPFPATSLEAMALSLDETARRARISHDSEGLLPRPTVVDLARQVEKIVRRNLP